MTVAYYYKGLWEYYSTIEYIGSRCTPIDIKYNIVFAVIGRQKYPNRNTLKKDIIRK